MIDLVSTFILVVGFADDLRSRKIHNKLLIGLLLFAAVVIFTLRGVSGLGEGALGFAIASALALPFVLFGVIGAGDWKLFAVFGFTSDPRSIIQVFIYSIIAGAILGLVRAALGGELVAVLKSTATIAMNRLIVKPTGKFNIPFSAALLLAWLTEWALRAHGGGLL